MNEVVGAARGAPGRARRRIVPWSWQRRFSGQEVVQGRPSRSRWSDAEPPPLLTWTVYSVYLLDCADRVRAPSEWLTSSTSVIEMQIVAAESGVTTREAWAVRGRRLRDAHERSQRHDQHGRCDAEPRVCPIPRHSAVLRRATRPVRLGNWSQLGRQTFNRPRNRSEPRRCRSRGGGPTTRRTRADRTGQTWRRFGIRGARESAPGNRVSNRVPDRPGPLGRRGGRAGRVREGLPRARALPARRALSAVAAPDRRERGSQPTEIGGAAREPRAAPGRRGPPGGRGPVPRGGTALGRPARGAARRGRSGCARRSGSSSRAGSSSGSARTRPRRRSGSSSARSSRARRARSRNCVRRWSGEPRARASRAPDRVPGRARPRAARAGAARASRAQVVARARAGRARRRRCAARDPADARGDPRPVPDRRRRGAAGRDAAARAGAAARCSAERSRSRPRRARSTSRCSCRATRSPPTSTGRWSTCAGSGTCSRSGAASSCPFAQKQVGPGSQTVGVEVRGATGLWITGARHEIIYRDPATDQIVAKSRRLAGNVLIWEARRGHLPARGREDGRRRPGRRPEPQSPLAVYRG